MPLNALNVEKKVKAIRMEYVYRWENLDLGKTKEAILNDPTHKKEQNFIWNIEGIRWIKNFYEVKVLNYLHFLNVEEPGKAHYNDSAFKRSILDLGKTKTVLIKTNLLKKGEWIFTSLREFRELRKCNKDIALNYLHSLNVEEPGKTIPTSQSIRGIFWLC